MKFSTKQKKEVLNLLNESLKKYNGKARNPYFWKALQEYTDIFFDYAKKHNIDDWWDTESYCYQRVWKNITWKERVK